MSWKKKQKKMVVQQMSLLPKENKKKWDTVWLKPQNSIPSSLFWGINNQGPMF